MNAGLSLSPDIEVLIVSIPNIRTAKPSIIEPIFFFLSSFENAIIIKPTTARTRVNEEGFKSLTKNASPLMPAVLKSHAVTVVPTFAPIIMIMVCPIFIIPEITKPTRITVVAAED